MTKSVREPAYLHEGKNKLETGEWIMRRGYLLADVIEVVLGVCCHGAEEGVRLNLQ